MTYVIDSKHKKLKVELERLLKIDPTDKVRHSFPFVLNRNTVKNNTHVQISTYHLFMDIYEVRYKEVSLNEFNELRYKHLYTYEFHWIEEFEEWLKIYN